MDPLIFQAMRDELYAIVKTAEPGKNDVMQQIAKKYPDLIKKKEAGAEDIGGAAGGIAGAHYLGEAGKAVGKSVGGTAGRAAGGLLGTVAGWHAGSRAGKGLGAVVDRALDLVDKKKQAGAGGVLQRLASDAGTHKAELAGLGILAAPAVDHLQARIRARAAGEQGEHAVAKRQFMGETGHAVTELGGLGVLAGPSIAHLLHH